MNRTQKNKLIRAWIIVVGVLMGITISFCWLPVVAVPAMILTILLTIVGFVVMYVDLFRD